jgi:hypothetical protein
MRVGSRCAALPFAILIFCGVAARAQEPTVGLLTNTPEAWVGYTLFSPQGENTTYLINNGGLVVNSWTATVPPGLMAYLRDNGNLVRSGRLSGSGGAGLVQEFDWDGNLIWEFEYASGGNVTHHDIEPMPNGNVLLIAYEVKTQAEAIQAGRNPVTIPGELWPDHVIEVEPVLPTGGNIVWEWHVWDHLIQDFDASKDNYGVVADHPELVDINFTGDATPVNWTHLNGVSYNADLDQIIVSSRTLSEVWVLDHSTTTAEAAGHTGGNSGMGGDLLYRWGNPQAYGRGDESDRKLFSQHDATWVPQGYPGEGNILVFNNGKGRPAPEYSSVDEFVPPVDGNGSYSLESGEAFGPAAVTWSYSTTPAEFYSIQFSGAQRLEDGTTLICDGIKGRLFEVRDDHTIVWDYINPVSGGAGVPQGAAPPMTRVFKARRYPPDFPGFAGKDLTPGDPIETFTPPLSVPQGSLAASRVSDTTIDVSWDTSTCTASSYDLIYGHLADVDSLALLGAECDIGVSGAFAWTGVPSGPLYFIVVGRDSSGIYESGWGVDSAGNPRLPYLAAGLCGSTTKVITSTCP